MFSAIDTTEYFLNFFSFHDLFAIICAVGRIVAVTIKTVRSVARCVVFVCNRGKSGLHGTMVPDKVWRGLFVKTNFRESATENIPLFLLQIFEC